MVHCRGAFPANRELNKKMSKENTFGGKKEGKESGRRTGQCGEEREEVKMGTKGNS